eukprot:scaffold51741_cov86-Cyclotella_meneghiniana.AAC.7
MQEKENKRRSSLNPKVRSTIANIRQFWKRQLPSCGSRRFLSASDIYVMPCMCGAQCGKRKTENRQIGEGGTKATRDVHVVATHRTISDADTPSSIIHNPYQDMRCDTSRYLWLHLSALAVGRYG